MISAPRVAETQAQSRQAAQPRIRHDRRQHRVVKHLGERRAGAGDCERNRDDHDAAARGARNGEPQHHDRGNHHDHERADPRFAPADLVRDRTEERRKARGDQARESVDVAPRFLAAHRIADDFGAEVRSEDVDDDEDVVRIARPLEQRPADLSQATRFGRAEGDGAVTRRASLIAVSPGRFFPRGCGRRSCDSTITSIGISVG